MDVIAGQRASVAELWRYPVKSMRGERVAACDVTDVGCSGDRAYVVTDPATGKVGSAKHPRLWGALLQCQARYRERPRDGEPLPPVSITLPDGGETGSDDPQVDERLSAVFGRPVHLTTVAPDSTDYDAVWPEIDGVLPDDFRQQHAVEGTEPDGTLTELTLAGAAPPGTFFDFAALHVVTVATLDRLGELEPGSRFAVERFRPNIVIDSTGEPFAENGWGGSSMRFGATLITSVVIPTMRCIMTTLAQGELPRDSDVLRALTRHNRVEIPGAGAWSCVGAYAAVSAPGPVQLGDPVVLGTA